MTSSNKYSQLIYRILAKIGKPKSKNLRTWSQEKRSSHYRKTKRALLNRRQHLKRQVETVIRYIFI